MEIGIVPRYKVPITSLSWKKEGKNKEGNKGRKKKRERGP